jgi:hypothetical protein
MAIRIGDLDGGFPSDPTSIASWATQPTTGPDDPYGCLFLFEASVGSARLQVQSFDNKLNQFYDMHRFPVVGVWGSWKIDLSSDDAGVTISMLLDEGLALEPTHLDICRMGGDVDVEPGFFFTRGPAQARFDNVRIGLR